MTWVWVYLDRAGNPAAQLPAAAVSTGFPTQSDAENYIGESWRELLDGGVDAVSLYEGDRFVYGPMALHAG
jgi:hypothetical protein